jgi:hypothetical protein
MATGRTAGRWTRVYLNGYDVSGETRSIEPLMCEFAESEVTALSDSTKTYLPNHPTIGPAELRGIYDNTSILGIPALMDVTGVKVNVLVAKGIRAVPAVGDPTFGGEFMLGAHTAIEEGGAVFISMPLMGWAADASTVAYPVAWGNLLHANTLESAANTADAGVESATGAATAFGGYMMYHVTAAAGGAGVTATIKVRWQIVLGTATSVTFVLAFMRGIS